MVKDQPKLFDRAEISDEAMHLSLDYIYYRLQKADYTWFSCPTLPDPQRVQLVMRELGDEFEQRYKENFGELSSLLNVTVMSTYYNFLQVCNELFKEEDYQKLNDGRISIKWSRIVALYAFGGLLAVECVKNGLEELLPDIASWIHIYVRNKLAYWICKNGGWDGLVEYYETRDFNQKWDSVKTAITTVGAACGVVALAVMLANRL